MMQLQPSVTTAVCGPLGGGPYPIPQELLAVLMERILFAGGLGTQLSPIII